MKNILVALSLMVTLAGCVPQQASQPNYQPTAEQRAMQDMANIANTPRPQGLKCRSYYVFGQLHTDCN